MLGLSFIVPLAVAVALGNVWLVPALGQFSADLLQTREQFVLDSATTVGAHAVHAAREVDMFFLERLRDIKELASELSVIDAARRGAEAHQAQGLSDMNIDDVEAQMRESRSLRLFPRLDLYLLYQISSNPYLLSASVTDRFGYNVAMTYFMPDFVQRDERWWQVAWKTGLDVGYPEYHPRAPVKSLTIAMRIDDLISKRGLGVLLVNLDMKYVQSILDSAAGFTPGIEVSVFARGGELLANTEVGRAPERVGSRAAGDGADSSGAAQDLVDSDTIVEFARTGSGAAYRSFRADYRGLGWQIQVKGLPDEMYPNLATLKEILQETTTWPQYLVVFSGASGLGVLGTCLAIVWMLARRFSRRLSQVRSAQSRATTHRGKERNNILITYNPQPSRGHDGGSTSDAHRRAQDDGRAGQKGRGVPA